MVAIFVAPIDLIEKNLFKRNVIKICELSSIKVFVEVCTVQWRSFFRRLCCKTVEDKYLKVSQKFPASKSAVVCPWWPENFVNKNFSINFLNVSDSYVPENDGLNPENVGLIPKDVLSKDGLYPENELLTFKVAFPSRLLSLLSSEKSTYSISLTFVIDICSKCALENDGLNPENVGLIPKDVIAPKKASTMIGFVDLNHASCRRSRYRFKVPRNDEEWWPCPWSGSWGSQGSQRSTSWMNDLLLRCGDVAKNPGPQRTDVGQKASSSPPIQVISYNVRGLNDERKMRHLLCHYQKKCNKDLDLIVCLQETFLEKPGRLPYIWRGNYFLTEGGGNSCGCITLLSHHLTVVASKNIDNRAHVIVCAKNDAARYIVANLYAPNPNGREKSEFYEKVFDVIFDFEQTYNCQQTIVAGDFNLAFKKEETKNRLFTPQEKRVGDSLKATMNAAGMSDCWREGSRFTWRRPNSDIFSTIDRVLFSEASLKMLDASSNWALSYSDHAEVAVSFESNDQKCFQRARIPRLDPSLIKERDTRSQIELDFVEMLNQGSASWDPHMKLEYAKMCLRTVAEKVQAERKRREKSEEELLNEELNLAINR